MEKEQYAEILLDTGALKISPTEPFQYATDMLSPVYTNTRAIISFPEGRRQIVDGLVELVGDAVYKGGATLVVGAASSGISLATYLSYRLHLPMAYVREYAKTHGKGNQIEGTIKKGDKAILVADVLSGGTDITHSVKLLKSKGCEVLFCATISSNNLGKIEPFLKREKIPFASLTDIATIINVANVKHIITAREREDIEKWMSNPENWAKNRKAAIRKRKSRQRPHIAELLLKIGAITINTKKPYKYVSGIYSPIYTDNRLLMSHPDEWKGVMDACVDTIVEEIGLQNIDIIGGTATAGIPHAAYLSERLGLPMIYIKSKKDSAGKKEYIIEGVLPKNSRVLMMEDLISSGGSVIGSVDAVRKAGGIADHVLAIVTYQMKKSVENFKAKEVNVFTLTDVNTLLDVATKENYIKPAEKEIVIDWTKDTKGWGKKRGFE